MHNLDSFLQHVEDDLAVSETAAPVAAPAGRKGKKAAAKEVPVVSSQESEEVPAALVKKGSDNKLLGGVNFVLGDIDTASSLVRG